MTSKPCPHEEKIAATARSGQWSPDLMAHRDSCMACAELTLVVAALAADAKELCGIDQPLPDPTPIWLRAQLAARDRDYERATRAIVWVQRAAMAVVVGIGIFLAPGLWGFLSGLAAKFDLSLMTPSFSRSAGSPILVMVVSMLVLGGLALWELTIAQEN